MGTIGASPDFGGFQGWKPLGVGDGGSAAVFDLKEFRSALENGGEYVCCGNFGWLDWRYSTAPGVPVLRSSVASYADALFNPKASKFNTLKFTNSLNIAKRKHTHTEVQTQTQTKTQTQTQTKTKE